MLLSRDVDCCTRDDPGRIFELQDELGEGSAFEQTHVHFLDPNDAAVSKYARGDVRDREWLRAGLAAGLLSTPVIDSRFRQTADNAGPPAHPPYTKPAKIFLTTGLSGLM